MKKLALTMAFGLVAMFTACSDDSSSGPSTTSVPESVKTLEELIKGVPCNAEAQCQKVHVEEYNDDMRCENGAWTAVIPTMPSKVCSDTPASSSSVADIPSDINNSSSSIVSGDLPAGDSKVTCTMTKDEPNLLEHVIVVPDSGTSIVTISFMDGVVTTVTKAIFDEKASAETIAQECAETKAETDGEVVCDGRTITETVVVEDPTGFSFQFIAPMMKSMCEEIQKTGVMPEEDEEDEDFDF